MCCSCDPAQDESKWRVAGQDNVCFRPSITFASNISPSSASIATSLVAAVVAAQSGDDGDIGEPAGAAVAFEVT